MSLQVRRGTSTSPDARTAVREVYAALAGDDVQLIIFYCSPAYDLTALADEWRTLTGPDGPVIGATTAGEITPLGYLDGSLTAVALCGGVRAHVERIDGITALELTSVGWHAERAVAAARAQREDMTAHNTFAFLLVDGMSRQEEALASLLYTALGGMALFGGSAADGLRFGTPYLYHAGAFRSDCALVTLITTLSSFVVFKTDHFTPSPNKLVITGAEPARRIVHEINGAPAAREYARLIGLDVENLTPMIFAEHPVVVTIGGNSYARSIQCVNPDESLSFFCAIDEGIVLTIAERQDLVARLEAAFADVRRRVGPPALVLGCDCILRSIEIGQRGLRDRVSAILQANNVVGFATYGEQYNGMHINQTFTGVAVGAE